jgi:hypothetical protein
VRSYGKLWRVGARRTGRERHEKSTTREQNRLVDRHVLSRCPIVFFVYRGQSPGGCVPATHLVNAIGAAVAG